MACNHHHHHSPCPTTAAPSGPCCCTHHHQPPPCHPPPPSSDHLLLLQSVLSHLIQNPNHPTSSAVSHFPSPLRHHQNHPKQHSLASQFETQYPILESLIRRIDDLEFALRELNSCSSSSDSGSLRDAAARVIQSRFRAFLVRRSVALRHLKELAAIKSGLAGLRSTVKGCSRVDFAGVSRKATDLLIWVDSIQAGDPMIRDGKRSITREIVRFLELLDGLNVDRVERLTRMKTSKDVGLVRNLDRTKVLRLGLDNEKASRRNTVSEGYDSGIGRGRPVDELRERVERIRRLSKALEEDDDEDMKSDGFKRVVVDDVDGERAGTHNNKDGVSGRNALGRGNVKKHVTFLDGSNFAKIYGVDEDEIQVVESLDKQSTESDQEDVGSEGSSQASGDGRNPKMDLTAPTYDEDGKPRQRQNEELLFAAPLPVIMESRADTMKNKKKRGVTCAE